MESQQSADAIRRAVFEQSVSIVDLLQTAERSDEAAVLDVLTDGRTWSSKWAPVRIAQTTARNARCPVAVLTRLAAHPDMYVRVAVAKHPETPASVVDALRTDAVDAVASAATVNYGPAVWRSAPSELREHPSATALKSLADRWGGTPDEFNRAAPGIIVE